MFEPSPRTLRARAAAAGDRVRALCGWALCLVLVCALAGHARARRESAFHYPYARVWTAAVRLMRIDFECSISEKDKDDGYFLFDYPDRGKLYPGSVELVAPHGEQGAVHVVVKIAAMPSYVEAMILERLARKLEQEYGPAKEPKPSPAAPDHKKDGADRPSGADDGKADAGDREQPSAQTP